MSFQDLVELEVRRSPGEYQSVLDSQRGDSFFIRTHLEHNAVEESGEASFRKGQVFQVVDTLHNGVVGAWQAVPWGETKINKGSVLIPIRFAFQGTASSAKSVSFRTRSARKTFLRSSTRAMTRRARG